VIFTNPSGAPELACDECGCRWFDRLTGTCYECGAEVPPEAMQAFQQALQAFAASPTRARRAPDDPGVASQPTPP
jgi:DNA-directed RNA polymerase subunit RPC12/RpoP